MRLPSGSPLHRENRENDPKKSLSGKIQEICKFCQNTGNSVCSSCKFPDSKGKGYCDICHEFSIFFKETFLSSSPVFKCKLSPLRASEFKKSKQNVYAIVTQMDMTFYRDKMCPDSSDIPQYGSGGREVDKEAVPCRAPEHRGCQRATAQGLR